MLLTEVIFDSLLALDCAINIYADPSVATPDRSGEPLRVIVVELDPPVCAADDPEIAVVGPAPLAAVSLPLDAL